MVILEDVVFAVTELYCILQETHEATTKEPATTVTVAWSHVGFARAEKRHLNTPVVN